MNYSQAPKKAFKNIYYLFIFLRGIQLSIILLDFFIFLNKETGRRKNETYRLLQRNSV